MVEVAVYDPVEEMTDVEPLPSPGGVRVTNDVDGAATPPDDARRLLMVYLGRINELADRPEFYNLLTNSSV